MTIPTKFKSQAPQTPPLLHEDLSLDGSTIRPRVMRLRKREGSSLATSTIASSTVASISRPYFSSSCSASSSDIAKSSHKRKFSDIIDLTEPIDSDSKDYNLDHSSKRRRTLASSTFSSALDSASSTAIVPRSICGIKGIINTGNNCWLNSVLQVFLNDAQLKNYLSFCNRDIISLEENGIINFRESEFILSCRNFIEQYESSRAILDSQPLREKLAGIDSNIEPIDRSVDSQEALLSILTFLMKLQLVNYTMFTRTEGISLKEEIEPNPGMVTLSNLKNNQHLNSMLKVYFSSQKRDDERINSVKRYFDSPPKNLFIHLNRLTFEDKLKYCNFNINVPFFLKIDKEHFINETDANYTLASFILYSGNGTCGHYVSCIQKNGHWFLCNDASVREISLSKALQYVKTAYIFNFKLNESSSALSTSVISSSAASSARPHALAFSRSSLAVEEKKTCPSFACSSARTSSIASSVLTPSSSSSLSHSASSSSFVSSSSASSSIKPSFCLLS